MSTEPNKVIYSMVGVSKYYDKKAVLKDIYLSYFYGAKIGVIGLNGSGKSSLLRILAGVDKEFGGDPSKMVAFMHWAWKGEQRREAYAKDKGYERRRMSWRVQFSAELLTDYRVHALRGQK